VQLVEEAGGDIEAVLRIGVSADRLDKAGVVIQYDGVTVDLALL
jgi:hypothetical protein